MLHKIKIFLYRHSLHILFKKYRNKWFDEQLRELIKDTLEEMPKDFWKKLWLGEY